jgi:hypothetical protein
MQSKRFFFEKKAEPLAKQKTFFMLGHGLWRGQRPRPSINLVKNDSNAGFRALMPSTPMTQFSKSFLLLFFKKEALSCLPA